MTLFITRKKHVAERKLKEFFTTKIISNVQKIGQDYTIEYLTQKDYYRQSVEAQTNMPKYLQYLLQDLEGDMEQSEREAELNEQIEDLDETVANTIKEVREEIEETEDMEDKDDNEKIIEGLDKQFKE